MVWHTDDWLLQATTLSECSRETDLQLAANKCDDLSNWNNYRATAVSFAVSKLFESIIAYYFDLARDVNAYAPASMPCHPRPVSYVYKCSELQHSVSISLDLCRNIDQGTI